MITHKLMVVLLALVVGAMSGCSASTATLPPPNDPPSSAVTSITLLAAGDNLIHDVIYQQAARRAEAGGYDFRPAYAAIADLVAAADLALMNQETLVVPGIAPASYPRFATPPALGEQMAELGFDVFAMANNHAYDQGKEGLAASRGFWDRVPDCVAPGTCGPQGEDAIHYVTMQGVRIALLAATQYTNGLTLPADAPIRVLSLSEEALLSRLMKEARQNADFVVFYAHWGQEDSNQVTDAQRQMAHKLAGWGADLILGSHPHRLQPCETITKADGGTALVLYSLGNLISAQQSPQALAGALLEVTITKAENQPAAVSAHRLIPIVTQYGDGYRNLHLILLSDYTGKEAAEHGVRRWQTPLSPEAMVSLFRDTYPVCGVLPPVEGDNVPSPQPSGTGTTASIPK